MIFVIYVHQKYGDSLSYRQPQIEQSKSRFYCFSSIIHTNQSQTTTKWQMHSANVKQLKWN